MPMRNRVTPIGDIVATPLRGAWLGNRGILHEDTDVVRFHRGPLWIICALRYRESRLPQWTPGHYTVLFFHDEAVALAAGHRPCAQCRRGAYDAYREAWSRGTGLPVPRAADIDRRLHQERIVTGTHRRLLHASSWPDLPSGTFVLSGDATAAGTTAGDTLPMLVLDDRVVPWTTDGYASARDRPVRGPVQVITPPSTVAALAGGYRPQTAA